MCALCGGIDPSHDLLIVQAALAAGAATPWVLRERLREAFDRARGQAPSIESEPDACELDPRESTDPPAT
jgi:hypothetical protein